MLQLTKTCLAGLSKDANDMMGVVSTEIFGKKIQLDIIFENCSEIPSPVQLQTLNRVDQELDRFLTMAMDSVAEYLRNNPEIAQPWYSDMSLIGHEAVQRQVLLQTLYVQDSDKLGDFGLGFWAEFDQEHGLGLRFHEYQVSEVGGNEVYFS